MQYDFRQKLNAVDSNRFRGFQLPEVDWKLNSALRLLVNRLSGPRFQPEIGFEFNQRNIDDLRPLFRTEELTVVNNFATHPTDYLRLIAAWATATKGDCEKNLRIWFAQRDDLWESDPFAKSSFEWEELTALQANGGMELKPTDFTVSSVTLDYVAQHPYMHSTAYSLPDGTVLTGSQDCLMADDFCSEVVDLAVFMTVNDTIFSFETKQQNLTLR